MPLQAKKNRRPDWIAGAKQQLMLTAASLTLAALYYFFSLAHKSPERQLATAYFALSVVYSLDGIAHQTTQHACEETNEKCAAERHKLVSNNQMPACVATARIEQSTPASSRHLLGFPFVFDVAAYDHCQYCAKQVVAPNLSATCNAYQLNKQQILVDLGAGALKKAFNTIAKGDISLEAIKNNVEQATQAYYAKAKEGGVTSTVTELTQGGIDAFVKTSLTAADATTVALKAAELYRTLDNETNVVDYILAIPIACAIWLLTAGEIKYTYEPNYAFLLCALAAYQISLHMHMIPVHRYMVLLPFLWFYGVKIRRVPVGLSRVFIVLTWLWGLFFYYSCESVERVLDATFFADVRQQVSRELLRLRNTAAKYSSSGSSGSSLVSDPTKDGPLSNMRTASRLYHIKERPDDFVFNSKTNKITIGQRVFEVPTSCTGLEEERKLACALCKAHVSIQRAKSERPGLAAENPYLDPNNYWPLETAQVQAEDCFSHAAAQGVDSLGWTTIANNIFGIY